MKRGERAVGAVAIAINDTGNYIVDTTAVVVYDNIVDKKGGKMIELVKNVTKKGRRDGDILTRI